LRLNNAILAVAIEVLKMDVHVNRIELTLPFKAEYVSIARLVVSGVASRMGFDIEAIEDIKVAVSEVCNKLVEAGSFETTSYSIVFEIRSKKLVITYYSTDKKLNSIFAGSDDDLGVSIINAIMDDTQLCPKHSYILSMSKAIEV
jgi:serine/threonine-protein kinase RsbW